MKPALLLCALALVLRPLGAVTCWQDTIDDQARLELELPATDLPGSPDQIAQNLNLCAPADLQAFSLRLKDAVPGNLQVQVCSDVAGQPGAAISQTFTFPTATALSWPQWSEFPLGDPGISLPAGASWLVWSFVPEDDSRLVVYTGEGLNQSCLLGKDQTWLGWPVADDLQQRVLLVYSGEEAPCARLELGSESHLGTLPVQSAGLLPLWNRGPGALQLQQCWQFGNGTMTLDLPQDLPLEMAAGDTLYVPYTCQAAGASADSCELVCQWSDGSGVRLFEESLRFRLASCATPTRDWNPQEERLWYSSSLSGTGQPWRVDRGTGAHGAVALQVAGQESDTTMSLLWTLLPNPDSKALQLAFMHSQRNSAATAVHGLVLGELKQDSVAWSYSLDLSNEAYRAEAGQWLKTSITTSFPADTVAVGFFYAGLVADDWYIDDVELCLVEAPPCDPVTLDLRYQDGLLQFSWDPRPGEDLRLEYHALNESLFLPIHILDAGSGHFSMSPEGYAGLFRAVINCNPIVEDRMELQVPAVSRSRSQRLTSRSQEIH